MWTKKIGDILGLSDGLDFSSIPLSFRSSSGKHTIRIVVMGEHGQKAKDNYIDGLQITPKEIIR